jgi:hypothetical protein
MADCWRCHCSGGKCAVLAGESTLIDAERITSMDRYQPFLKYFLVFLGGFLIALPISEKKEIINFCIFLATAALAAIAWIQLKALNVQSNASFLLTFNREFFGNGTNQSIITAIEESKNILKEHGGDHTMSQLDDYLGYYDMVSLFWKKNLIDFDTVDEMFGHYMSKAWRNKEINQYIIDTRKEEGGDPRYYKPFEDLVAKIIEIENKVRRY